jgi:AcrR family transcriptional regulator
VPNGGKAESSGGRAGSTDDRELRSQGRRTQARLLEAGMNVLADKGYHAARVDDIVKAAEVSHGTFYLYFANKQELLRALAERCADEMAGVIAALGPVSPDAAGRRTVRVWLDEFVANYARYGVVIRAWMEGTVSDPELVQLGSRTFGAVAETLVDRVQQAGAVPADDAGLGAASLLALIERHTYYVDSRGGGVDDTTLDTLAALVHRGWFNGN